MLDGSPLILSVVVGSDWKYVMRDAMVYYIYIRHA